MALRNNLQISPNAAPMERKRITLRDTSIATKLQRNNVAI